MSARALSSGDPEGNESNSRVQSEQCKRSDLREMSQSKDTNGTTGVFDAAKENGASRANQILPEAETRGKDGLKGSNFMSPTETTDSPRPNAGPVLEEYCFVPYIEYSELAISESLKRYASDCFNYTLKFLEEWIMKDENNYVPNREVLIDVLARQRARRSIGFENMYSGPDCGLAQALQKLFRLPLSSDMYQQVNSLLNECRDVFYTDQLLSSLHTTEILKPCLDIVEENTDGESTLVLEVGGVQNAMHDRIMSIVASFPSKPLVYQVVNPSPAPDSSGNASMCGRESSAQEQAPVDLLILNHILHKQVNIDTALDLYFDRYLKPGGFVLVKEVTGNFPLCLTLEALSETAEYPRIRAGRVLGRYLHDTAWSELFSRHGFDIIYKRSDGVFATLYLLRKRRNQLDSAHSMIFQMSDLHFSWLEDLSAKTRKMATLPESEPTRMWLLAMKTTNGLVGFLKSLRREAGGDRFRGVLISNLKLASRVPQISADSEEFRWLVQRDLAQNVFRDGTWGSFRHVPLSTGIPSGSPTSRATCSPNKTYAIVSATENQGGPEELVGLGLLQWLADRGAQKILLCHRANSISKTDNQTAAVVRSLQAKGIQVEVSRRDVTTVDGAWGLVNQAQTLAPLGGVFHLHWATRYGMFQRQTRDSFQDVYDLKVQATVNLDHVTRSLCRDSLEWFVVSSSTSAGRGRPGHTNSGYASSVVERICEKRQADKLPGLSIQLDSRSGQDDLSEAAVSRYLTALDVLLPHGSCPVVSAVVNKP
ncbi:fatty acid synthase [Elysia marginata]|uniref:Fatty acid synthase n=1 Tax=Elysia marginata TaxID=1093978 RepID=A0AAV4GX14_9GAST|nr:fatty acid synthase [Elysia marginata]